MPPLMAWQRPDGTLGLAAALRPRKGPFSVHDRYTVIHPCRPSAVQIQADEGMPSPPRVDSRSLRACPKPGAARPMQEIYDFIDQQVVRVRADAAGRRGGVKHAALSDDGVANLVPAYANALLGLRNSPRPLTPFTPRPWRSM